MLCWFSSVNSNAELPQFHSSFNKAINRDNKEKPRTWKGVFPVTTTIVIIPVNHVYSVNTYFWIQLSRVSELNEQSCDWSNRANGVSKVSSRQSGPLKTSSSVTHHKSVQKGRLLFSPMSVGRLDVSHAFHCNASLTRASRQRVSRVQMLFSSSLETRP